MRSFILVAGLLFLLAVEILRVYFIMPFPGSQESDTVDIAYWLNNNITWIRILGFIIIAYPLVFVFRHGKRWKKLFLSMGLILYAVIFYMFNFRFLADKMFYQPKTKTFTTAENNKVPNEKLVLGIAVNNEAKAYPIQLIGYHHQVRDSINGKPVMVTYCTVCRTGRVFEPTVNGKNESFRLVGMDHFNAMFEDASTRSWWQQATGVAITGPLKGSALKEIPSQQVTLDAWLTQYPNTLILQPDASFKKEYDHLASFDKGTGKSDLTKRDSGSWNLKSWVVGVAHGGDSKAYDWNDLVTKKIIQDSLPDLPLVIVLAQDTASFHVWSRKLNGDYLRFENVVGTNVFKDLNTNSTWNMNGLCIEGPLMGKQLMRVSASQEFWHSWLTFHPRTARYK